MPPVFHLASRAPAVKAATERAIDAVLGRRVVMKEKVRDLGREVDEVFRAARRGET